MSIWKGNDPRPFDIVDDCDAVDIPSTFRLGGGGSGVSGGGFEGLTLLPENACCARGERGGVRAGLSEIGDGGTNGKPSRMESARVEAELTTDARESLVSISSMACRCCRSSTPVGSAGVVALLDGTGETSFALVIRYCDRAVLSGALTGV